MPGGGTCFPRGGVCRSEDAERGSLVQEDDGFADVLKFYRSSTMFDLVLFWFCPLKMFWFTWDLRSNAGKGDDLPIADVHPHF